MPVLTLLDMAKRAGIDQIIGLVDDVIYNAPEINFFPALPKVGTSYRVGRITNWPKSQFAKVSGGSTPSKSTFDQKVASLNLVNQQLQVPEEIVLADEGASVEDILSGEASRALKANWQLIGKQIYYGTAADSNGFQGLQTTINGVPGLEVDASAGSPNAAGSNSSAYLIRLEDDAASLAVGKNGSMNLTPWQRQQVVLSGSGNSQLVTMAYVSAFIAYFGLTVASAWSAWRIKNISSAIGKGGGGTTFNLTDALAAELVAQIPQQFRRNLRWFITRDAAFSLQASRTAINYQPAIQGGGQPAWAPAPTVLEGYPITITDSLENPFNGTGGE